MQWLMAHVLELDIIFFIVLFISGMAAFLTNGLGLTKFELNFIWQGVSTLMGAGVFSSVKYIADSWKNSEQGVNPYGGGKE